MENTSKYKVSFWRSGAHKPMGSRMFNTEEEAYEYFNQYTPQDEKEEARGIGESAEIKLEIVSIHKNGIEADAQLIDSMHVVQQDSID